MPGEEVDRPVYFVTTEHKLNLDRYVAKPNDVQLARYFYLNINGVLGHN